MFLILRKRIHCMIAVENNRTPVIEGMEITLTTPILEMVSGADYNTH